MKKALIALTMVVLMVTAGCAQEPSSEEEREYDAAVAAIEQEQNLHVGESMGVDYGDEHWQILVTDVQESHVNLSIRKIVADEVGQNKEGIDPTYTFNRTYVETGDLELIEKNMKVAVLGIEDGEVRIVFSDWPMKQSDVDVLVQHENGTLK